MHTNKNAAGDDKQTPDDKHKLVEQKEAFWDFFKHFPRVQLKELLGKKSSYLSVLMSNELQIQDSDLKSL